jgi:lipopolysaccharide export system protein LptA
MGPQKMVQMEACRAAFLKVACIAAALLLPGPVPAAAQTPVTGFSGLSGNNSKKPIDIESDKLEVDDKKHIAIFTGNVSATQGDYNLRSKRLDVTYEQGAAAGSQGQAATPAAKQASAPKAAASPATGDPVSNGQIKYIHATGGRVLMTSTKDDQKATGDEAFYDVKEQKVTLTGNVTLSQKGSVVTGQKLLINLDTGRAIMDPDEGAHRVRAVLMPNSTQGGGINPLGGGDKKKSKTPDNAPAKQAAPASGWQAQPH